jgi:hypothetical protein
MARTIPSPGAEAVAGRRGRRWPLPTAPETRWHGFVGSECGIWPALVVGAGSSAQRRALISTAISSLMLAGIV